MSKMTSVGKNSRDCSGEHVGERAVSLRENEMDRERVLVCVVVVEMVMARRGEEGEKAKTTPGSCQRSPLL